MASQNLPGHPIWIFFFQCFTYVLWLRVVNRYSLVNFRCRDADHLLGRPIFEPSVLGLSLPLNDSGELFTPGFFVEGVTFAISEVDLSAGDLYGEADKRNSVGASLVRCDQPDGKVQVPKNAGNGARLHSQAPEDGE